MQQQEEFSDQLRVQGKSPLPSEAAQLAERCGLGKPTAFYRASTSLFTVALLFFILAVLLLGGDGLLASIASRNGVLMAVLTPIAILPLLWPVYLCCQQALEVLHTASARAYFCQKGLIYVHRERLVVLHWEEIERTDIQYGWVRSCRVLLANGEHVTLSNEVGGNLNGQIRRRLVRVRKKHQHPDHSSGSEKLL